MTVTKRDLLAILAVIGAVGAMVLYRAVGVEPREWGAACLDMARAPWPCTPRAALLWLQHWGLWGTSALLLGFWAFMGRAWRAPGWVAPTAVALGVIAVLNFNATWGMVGAALGAWAWVGGMARQGVSA